MAEARGRRPGHRDHLFRGILTLRRAVDWILAAWKIARGGLLRFELACVDGCGVTARVYWLAERSSALLCSRCCCGADQRGSTVLACAVLHPFERQTAVDADRGRMTQLGAGLLVAGALVYTARNFRLSWEGHVTDRYTKAIEQLGSDRLDVRLGAIYGLERIMIDSERDHPTIVEVLAAFVREHSRVLTTRANETEEDERFRFPDSETDVRAAVRVLGRRPEGRTERGRVDLTGAYLVGAFLMNTRLSGAILKEAYLAKTNLSGADLSGADLSLAYMTSAVLTDAVMIDADLAGADLNQARMICADLTGANLNCATALAAELVGAKMAETIMSSADLTGADLAGADLTGADLTNANLNGAAVTEGEHYQCAAAWCQVAWRNVAESHDSRSVPSAAPGRVTA